MAIRSMTVSSRLMVLIGTAVAGIVVLGAVLVRDMGSVYQAANYANVNTVPSIRTLFAASLALDEMRVLTWQHIARTDTDHLHELEVSIASKHESLVKSLDQYQSSLLSDEQDATALRRDRDTLSSYDSLRERILGLSRAGKKEEARELLLGNQSTVTDLASALEAHQSYNIELGVAASKAAEATRRNSLMLSSAVILVVLISLIFVGRRTMHWLHGTLGGEPAEVAAVAQDVAGGNLSSKVDLRADDTTSLLATVAQMQADLRNRIERERAAAAQNDGMVAAIGKAMAQIEFNLDGTIITANSNFLQSVDYSLEEIRGRHHSIFVESAEAHSPAYREFWNKLRAGQFASGTFRRVGKNGRQVWLQASYNAILDPLGNPVKIIKFAIDVTEQLLTTEEIGTMARAAAEGDLTRRVSTEGKSGSLLSLSKAVNAMADAMSNIVGQISSVVEAVRTGTEEISKGNTDLSQRTEEQASSLGETATSMEEMTSTVKQTADNAAQANQLAVAARAQAEQGGAVVAEAVGAMKGINEASRKIADIIGVIDDIAFQTNLLALNAAVEAARAGEQGRGFAVVATEVRSLASRSASAAKEIKALIEDSVKKVDQGSHLVSQSGQSLSQIVVAVKKASDIVAEIASACKEQADGIDQVNRAVGSLDQVTQQNAALIEQTASAAQSLTSEAQNLDRMLASYRLGDGGKAPNASTTHVAVAAPPKPPAASTPVRARGHVARSKVSLPQMRKSGNSPASSALPSQPNAPMIEPVVVAGGDAEWSEF